jgi:pimeloyl-ACP methyl ester carboxylesterase
MERIEWGRHGPRVVLVHGDVFDSPATFAAMEPLAADHRLVLVNRRGFGASPAVEGEDFDVDAGDLAEVLVEEPTHLVGHSYGGVVSLIAAAQVPGSVKSLTVFEPPAFRLVADHPEVHRFTEAIQAMLTGDPPPAEFLRRFAALVGGDPSRFADTATGVLAARRTDTDARPVALGCGDPVGGPRRRCVAQARRVRRTQSDLRRSLRRAGAAAAGATRGLPRSRPQHPPAGRPSE